MSIGKTGFEGVFYIKRDAPRHVSLVRGHPEKVAKII